MRRFSLAVVALVAAIICLKLVYLELWLRDNDNYITLSTFFSSAGHDEYVRTARRLYEAMVASCAPGDGTCRASSASVLAEITYLQPIDAFFGSFVATPMALASSEAFLAAITRATVLKVVASAALAVMLLLALPRPIGAFLAWMLAVFGVLAVWLPEQAAFGALQPLLGVGAAGGLAVLLLAVAVAGLSRWVCRAPRPIPTPDVRRRVMFYCAAAAALTVTRVLLYRIPSLQRAYFSPSIPGAGVGLLIVLLAGVGLVLFVAAMRDAVAAGDTPASAAWVAILLFIALVSVGENFFSTAFHITARGHVFLLAVPMLVYLALRPNGWLVWTLPAFALFSVPIAGLFFGCVVAIESVASLRRRAPSLALVVAAALFVVAVFRTGNFADTPVIPTEAASLSAIVSRIDLTTFLPGLLVLLPLGAAAVVAWRLPDPGGGMLLHAVVLAAMLAGAGQLRHALVSAGVSIMDPAAFTYILLSQYLGPLACATGIFLTMLSLTTKRVPTAAGVTGVEVNGPALSLLVAAVLCLAAARAGNAVGRPQNVPMAIVRGAGIVMGVTSPAPVEPLVREAASPDDEYLIGPYPGHVATMMSVLKMKARAAAGLLDPTRATTVVAPRPGA